MSKAIKKVFKKIKKAVKSVGKFIKKHWKKIAIAAAIVFTAGAFAIQATGAGWGAAFNSIGTTMSAGVSSLTTSLGIEGIGTSAGVTAGTGALGSTALTNAASGSLGTAAQASAGQAMVSSTLTPEMLAAGQKGIAAFGVKGAQATALGLNAAAGTSVGSGLTIGKAMMANTALNAYGAYQDGKAQEEYNNARTYYGMRADGKGFSGQTRTSVPTVGIPGQKRVAGQSLAQPVEQQQPPESAYSAQPINRYAAAPQQVAAPVSSTRPLMQTQGARNMDDLAMEYENRYRGYS